MRRITTTVAVMALIAAGCGQGSDSAAVEGDEVIPPPATTDAPAVRGSPEADRVVPAPTPRAAPKASSADDASAFDERLDEVFVEAHAAMTAGRCESAIPLYDELLADEGWMESSGLARETSTQRSDCAAYVAIDHDGVDAAAVLAALVDFLADRPTTELEAVVTGVIRQHYADVGLAALSADSCDAIDRDFTLVTPEAPIVARVGCAAAYRTAGRTSEAFELAMSAFGETDDADLTSQVVGILSESWDLCLHMADGESLSGADEDALAALYRSCLADATARDDLDTLAGLQIAFLTDLAGHPDAPAVEAALVDNIAACDLLASVRRSDTFSDGFVLTKTFACAQVADYVGEVDAAIDRYEWFLQRAGSDARVAEAEAGLARNLIARARGGRTSELVRPDPVSGLGGGRAWLVFANDTAYDQRIVVAGPESQVVTVPASATSSTYAVPPTSCRTDVPVATIDLAPGTYEVMVYDDVAAPELGSWDLRAGAEYGWCAYYVRA